MNETNVIIISFPDLEKQQLKAISREISKGLENFGVKALFTNLKPQFLRRSELLDTCRQIITELERVPKGES